ncbi:MAG TPA: tetratricopeptide repeat protein [Polyangiaceae bacterium]
MDCERFERVVLDLLYEELDELTAASARRHLEHCARCQAIMQGLRATREVGALPLVDPPEGLELRILEAERKARSRLPIRQRFGRAVSVLAGYAMRPQLAMAALLLLAIGSSLIFLRGRPGDRERVQVTERGAPEGESEAVAILPVPAAQAPATAEAPKAVASAAPTTQKAEQAEAKNADIQVGGVDSESDGASAFEAAMAAFRDGRYGEARRQFDDVAARGGSQAAEAALLAAQSAKNGESCAVAVSLFDQVSTRYPGTQPGYDATLQAASCYETLGDTERAKRTYQALLDVPNYGERAKASLAQLERADQQPIEVAARKRAVAASSPPAAAAPAPAKPGAAAKAKASGPAQAVEVDQGKNNAAESR